VNYGEEVLKLKSVCIEFRWRSEEDKQRRRMMKRFFDIEFGYEILSCCWVVKMGLFRGFWVLSNPLWLGGGGGCGGDEEDDGGGGGWK